MALGLPLVFTMAGIAWNNFFTPTNIGLWALFYLAATLAWIFIGARTASKTVVAPLFFCLGSLCCLANQHLEMGLNEQLLSSDRAIAIVEHAEEAQTNAPRRYKAVLRIKKLRHNWKWSNVYSKLRIILIKSDVELAPGQKVFLNTKRLILLDSPKSMSIQAALWRSGIATSAIPKKWSVKLLNDRTKSLEQKSIELRESILASTKNNLSSLTEKLYTSVFMGKKIISATDPDKEQFCIWGLSHFLARSGLHMAIFAGIVWVAVQYIPFLALWLKSFLVLLMLIAYSLLSWPSISFLRSSWMLSLIMVGKMLNQNSNSRHLISIICLWVLLSNPFELFCADFQLSFSLAFGLIMSTRWLKKEQSIKVAQ